MLRRKVTNGVSVHVYSFPPSLTSPHGPSMKSFPSIREINASSDLKKDSFKSKKQTKIILSQV